MLSACFTAFLAFFAYIADESDSFLISLNPQAEFPMGLWEWGYAPSPRKML